MTHIHRKPWLLIVSFLTLSGLRNCPAIGADSISILDGPVRVDTGMLFVYGHELHPPYVFEMIPGNTLRINGIPICPTYDPTPEPKQEIPEELEIKHRMERRFLGKVTHLHLSLKDSGIVGQENFDRVEALVQQHPEVVDSVKVLPTGLWIWFKGDPYGEEILYTKVVKTPPTRRELVAARAAEFQRSLQRGRLLIISSCGSSLSVPNRPERIEAVLAEIRVAQVTPPASIKRNDFSHLGLKMAKQFADPVALSDVGQ